MPNLTQDRATARRGLTTFMVADAVAAAIFAGAMYTLDATGAAKPSAAGDKKPVRAVATVRADAGADAVHGERAVFCFDNSSGAAEIKRADIGANAYVADDHTVSKTGTSIAGEIMDIDDYGVWVAIGCAAVPTTA